MGGYAAYGGFGYGGLYGGAYGGLGFFDQQHGHHPQMQMQELGMIQRAKDTCKGARIGCKIGGYVGHPVKGAAVGGAIGYKVSKALGRMDDMEQLGMKHIY